MLAKLKIAILLVVVISSVTLIQTVEGASHVHVGVPGSPINAGSSFQITFFTDVGYNGMATVFVRPALSPTHIWQASPMSISGGLDYEVNDPGINTPGSYFAAVSFLKTGGGSAELGESLFSVVGPASVSTDWTIQSVSLTPPTPQVGDPVTFSAVLTALSSSSSYPQSVDVECTIDGISCGGGSVSYPGPTDNPATVSAQTTWTATPGTHTLTWSVSTNNDPNPSNNVMSISFTVTSPTPFDFSISASPSQQAVAPGSGTSFTVTVNLVSGPPQNVALTLSGAPAGVSGAFSPTSGTSSFSSTLNVMTTSAASPGTFPLTITGNGGGVTHTVQVALTVSQAPDFQIAVSPASQSALQGQTVSYSVNVVALNGFNSQVSLSVSGLPSGANGAFSIAIGTPNFASTLTVTLPTNIPTGSFTLTVTATGGGLSKVANMGLTISQALATQTSPTETSSTQAVTNLPGMSDLMTMLQQNPLLLLVLLIAIVAIVALASRHRKTSRPQQGTQQAEPGTKFCTKCGTPNPIGNEFCGKCGTKL